VQRFVIRVRRVGLAAVAAVSLVTAIVLIWLLVRPETLGAIGTVYLVLVLALAVFPLAALAAWWFDRRSPEPEDDTRAHEPGATDSARRHRRLRDQPRSVRRS